MKEKILLLILLFVSTIIVSQTKDTIQLNEVVITDSLDYSKNIIVLDKKSPELIKSTGQLMQEIPGVTFSKRSVFSVEPVINAFKYDQVNTSINGGISASSSCPNRMDPVTTRILPDEIVKIEYERGPYEVRYGQTMGGFVNIITNQKPDFEKFTVKGDVASEYNFNGNGSISSAKIIAGNKLFDANVSASYRKFDNYKSGNGTEISSSYKTYGINSGLGVNISDNQRVLLNYMYSKADDVMHAGLPMDAKYDESNLVSLDYSAKNINKIISRFNIKLFYASEDHLMTNEYRPNSAASLANTPVNSNDIGGRAELTVTPFDNLNIHLGADLKQTAKDGSKDVLVYKNICTNPPTIFDPPKEKHFEVWQNSYNQNIGGFFDAKYFFSDKFNAKIGIRFDMLKSDAKDVEEDFLILYNNNITPKNINTFGYYFKLNYKLPANFDISLATGKGNRAPSLLEKYINHFTVGLDAYEYVGNPFLKAETNNQADLIISKKHKNFYLFIDAFVSQITNYITAVEDSTIPRKSNPCMEPKYAKRFVNINEAMQYGFTFGGKISFLKYFYANFDVSYIYAQNISFDEPLPEIPPFTSLISVGYKKKNLSINLSNEYQAKQDRISELAGEKESEAFTVFNISASYLFFDKLNFGMAVDNIFNKNYYRHLSRPYKNMDTFSMFYEPGTSFRIFVKYKF